MKKNSLSQSPFAASVFAALLLTLVSGCAPQNNMPEKQNGQIDSQIFVNQVGYCPGQAKTAVIPANMDSFVVRDAATGEAVFSGVATSPEYWAMSGDTVRIAEFTSLTTPGSYFISGVDQSSGSYPFEINTGIYEDLASAALKAFYFNRTHIPIEEQYGGKWARAAGHPDTVVIVHESAASAYRKAGDTISAPYGWYDAGDYNKYIVNSAITCWTLLSFYETFDVAKDMVFDIPEKGNDMPDLLDEIYFNLRWAIKMQDEDGGVYHKLTAKNFEGFVMPDKAVNTRYVVQKSTAATLDFAAMLAQASRVYQPFMPEFSSQCIEAAKKAWAWAGQNPDIEYNQPADISTGAYGDNKLEDEFVWAGIELYIATKDPEYLAKVDLSALNPGNPQWADVQSLGIISLAVNATDFPAEAAIAREKIIGQADMLYDKYRSNPFRVSLDFFRWGSSSDVAIQGMFKLLAHQFSGEDKYLESALSDLDYLLGKNPTGYSFVTGFGDKQAMNIHHRPSAADGVDEPIPGFLVGGPNLATFDDCPDAERSRFPAKSFVDLECSYSTNEIAINWNAPFFYLAAGSNAVCK